MKKFSGLFVGTGAALTIGLGGIPDRVKIQNVKGSDLAYIVWDRRMTAATTCPEGIKYRDSSGVQMSALAAGNGVIRYYGGDVIAQAASSKIVPVNFAGGDPLVQGDMRDRGTLGTINAWTLDTSGSRTGHFNAGCNTTYVGVGSKILIGPAGSAGSRPAAAKWYRVVAITSDGDATDDVTLDQAAPSGEIYAISYKYELYQAPAGCRMPEGIVLSETADVNVSGELCYIEAEWDE